jgi:F-type H+-transporting ATPase subunit epsilon
MADSANNLTDLKLVVVTPEATVLDVAAGFVTVPLFDGEKGIGRGHAPLIGRLGFGELRYHSGGEAEKYYVDGGFVQVQDNMVSVLTNLAMPLEELDAETAEEQLKTALARKTKNMDETAIRDRLVSQARAQRRLAAKG